MTTAKKSTVKKLATKKAKHVKLESFKVGKEPKPFNTFKVTDQTVYWSILLILILILALWMLQIQVNINDMIDSTQSIN